MKKRMLSRPTDSGPLNEEGDELSSSQKSAVTKLFAKDGPHKASTLVHNTPGTSDFSPPHHAAIQNHLDDLERQGRIEKVKGGFGEYRKAAPPAEDKNE